MKNREALDFGKPLRRVRRYQSQDGGRYLSADQPGDRSGLTPAELDVRRPRCNDRGSNAAGGRGIPVVDRNRLAAQTGDRRDVGTSHENGDQKVGVVGRSDVVFSALPRANVSAEPGSSVPIAFLSGGGAAAATVKRSASIVAAATCVSIVLAAELSTPTMERESAMVAVVVSESTAAAPPAEGSGLESSGSGSAIRGGQRLGVHGGSSAIRGLQRRHR